MKNSNDGMQSFGNQYRSAQDYHPDLSTTRTPFPRSFPRLLVGLYLLPTFALGALLWFAYPKFGLAELKVVDSVVPRSTELG